MPATRSNSPPSKHHYVRVNGPTGLRLYVTNAALRDVPLALLQARVTNAIERGQGTRSYKSGRKSFSVKVNFERGEAHVQLSTEI